MEERTISIKENTFNLFAAVTGATQGSNTDALEEYLKSDTLGAHVNNPIVYWWEYLNANTQNAERVALARMAIDYLAIPGTS